MEQTPDNYFTNLAKIDVGEYIERKGKFSYLSWPYAVKTLRETDPAAIWEVIRHNGMPYMETGCGYFVEVAVTCQGITLSQIHPVLDNNNRPIAQPNAFQINTSIQRALVKAIALHGLGLYIYAGEDLPEGAEPTEEPNKEPPPKDTTTTKPSTATGNPGPMLTENQATYMQKLKKSKKISDDDFRRMIAELADGNSDLYQMSKKQAGELINLLTNYAVGA